MIRVSMTTPERVTEAHSERQFPGLEALRFASAMLVLIGHYTHFLAVPGAPRAYSVLPWQAALGFGYRSGSFGVIVFWFISGFIFTWKYAEAIHRRAVSGREFTVHRFSRLYPLHLLTLVLVAVGQQICVARYGEPFIYPNNDAYHFGLHLLFISGWVRPQSEYSFNGPIWSVSLEILVYAVFFLAARRLCLPLWHFLIAAVVLVSGAVIFKMVPLLTCLLCFAGGGMICRFHGLIAAWPGRGLCLALATVVVGGSLYLLQTLPPESVKVITVVALIAAGALVMVFASLHLAGLPRLVKLANFAGSMTYASYLLHFPVQLFWVLVCPSWIVVGHPVTLLAYLFVVCAISSVVYTRVEMPAQSWLRVRLRRG